MALTKARLLKHDFPFHGKIKNASVLQFSCVCVLETLRSKMLRFGGGGGTQGNLRPMRLGGLRAKTQRI